MEDKGHQRAVAPQSMQRRRTGTKTERGIPVFRGLLDSESNDNHGIALIFLNLAVITDDREECGALEDGVAGHRRGAYWCTSSGDGHGRFNGAVWRAVRAPGRDTNHYTTGRIGKHDDVPALLPNMGKAAAAGAAASFRSSYPNLTLSSSSAWKPSL